MKTVKFPLILAGIILFCALAVGVAAAEECCPADGCCTCLYTPGFWKNHVEAWPYPEFAGNELVILYYENEAVMGIGDIDLNHDGQDDSSLDALNYKGGPGLEGAQRILLRAAVAAALNEAILGDMFPATDDTANDVLAAFFGEDRDAMITLAEKLDDWNNGIYGG